MTLTFWQIIVILSAGAAMVALGAVIAGIFVYKTKYAGEEIFKKEHVPVGDAFNVDTDFLEEEIETSRPQDQAEIIEAQEQFLQQFNIDRMVGESKKYAEVEKD